MGRYSVARAADWPPATTGRALRPLRLFFVTSLLAAFAGQVQARDALICGLNAYTASTNASISYNSDAWNPVGDGFQCMEISNDPPSFNATWLWADDDSTVHSYPHVAFQSQQIPVQLQSLAALQLNAMWSYSTGNGATPYHRTLDTGLRDHDAMANVAFDMFLDADSERAQNVSTASIEIMIWVGTIGNPWPLGYSTNRTCFLQDLGGVNYTLYIGTNSNAATVYTWVAQTNQTAFYQEVSPLVQYLWRNDLIANDSYLGLIEFGSEAYHADENVTMAAADFSMTVVVGEAPLLELDDMPDKCSSTSVGRRICIPDAGQLSLFAIGLGCLLFFAF